MKQRFQITVVIETDFEPGIGVTTVREHFLRRISQVVSGIGRMVSLKGEPVELPDTSAFIKPIPRAGNESLRPIINQLSDSAPTSVENALHQHITNQLSGGSQKFVAEQPVIFKKHPQRLWIVNGYSGANRKVVEPAHEFYTLTAADNPKHTCSAYENEIEAATYCANCGMRPATDDFTMMDVCSEKCAHDLTEGASRFATGVEL